MSTPCQRPHGFALALLALACSAPRAAQETPPRPPNLVLIVADDLGYGELGCYGQEKIETPRLDRLAAEGTRFTRFYAGAPVCAPSRCSLLTGLHGGHAFVRDNLELDYGQLPLAAEARTLPELLQQAGYATCGIGKWGLGGPGTSGEPNAQGFERWFGYLCQREAQTFYPDHLWRDRERVDLPENPRGALAGEHYVHDLFLEEVERFLRAPRKRPFFLYLPFTLPHLALQPEDEDLEHYRGRFAERPYDGSRGYVPHRTPRAAYAAMITRLDLDVGRVLDLLAELGLERDTLVLFTSDNGPTNDSGGADTGFFESTAGLRGRKGSLYEGGIRVPLIARWPEKVPAGRTSAHLGALYDLMPTLLELAGVAAPPGLDGLSLVPELLGRPGQREHAHLFWEFWGYGGQQAVRLGRWKGIRTELWSGVTPLELYDLEADERESRDLAAEEPEIVGRMLALLEREHVPSLHFPLPGLDPAAAPAPPAATGDAGR
jgi:arylsulfatase